MCEGFKRLPLIGDWFFLKFTHVFFKRNFTSLSQMGRRKRTSRPVKVIKFIVHNEKFDFELTNDEKFKHSGELFNSKVKSLMRALQTEANEMQQSDSEETCTSEATQTIAPQQESSDETDSTKLESDTSEEDECEKTESEVVSSEEVSIFESFDCDFNEPKAKIEVFSMDYIETMDLDFIRYTDQQPIFDLE